MTICAVIIRLNHCQYDLTNKDPILHLKRRRSENENYSEERYSNSFSCPTYITFNYAELYILTSRIKL